MNYIILVLEFIVLICSIGLFIAKSEMTPNGPRTDINWNIALFITVILMIGINIRFICYGAYCFFTCGDESLEVKDAKEAVAIYRRAKAGKSLKAGIMGYGNVDLSNLNQDDEETEFLGITDPTEIKRIAEQNTKTLLQQNIANRQAVSKERVAARIDEAAAALKNKPNQKEVKFTPHAIEVGGGVPNKGQATKGTQGIILATPDQDKLPQVQMAPGVEVNAHGAIITRGNKTVGEVFGFNQRSKSAAPAPAAVKQPAAVKVVKALPKIPERAQEAKN